MIIFMYIILYIEKRLGHSLFGQVTRAINSDESSSDVYCLAVLA